MEGVSVIRRCRAAGDLKNRTSGPRALLCATSPFDWKPADWKPFDSHTQTLGPKFAQGASKTHCHEISGANTCQTTQQQTTQHALSLKSQEPCHDAIHALCTVHRTGCQQPKDNKKQKLSTVLSQPPPDVPRLAAMDSAVLPEPLVWMSSAAPAATSAATSSWCPSCAAIASAVCPPFRVRMSSAAPACASADGRHSRF